MHQTDRPGEPGHVNAKDGVPLSVFDSGPPADRADAPVIVLIHGFGGCKEDFADQFGLLARDHRVVALDHRGHGASGRPTAPTAYSLAQLADDVLAVVDTLGIPRFRLLGHSMGGLVARRIVLAHPDRVDAIVFLDALAGSIPGVDRAAAELGAEIARTRGMAAVSALLEESSPTNTYAGRRLLAERPGYAEFQARREADQSVDMWASLVVQLTEVQEDLHRLAAVSCPVLVLVGALDSEFLPASAAIAGAIAHAHFVMIPDAGHSPQFENGLAFNAALVAFLAGLDRERGRS